MATRAELENIAIQAAEYPQHHEAAKAGLREIAGRKHEEEAAVFAEFAAVDQQAYQARINASVTRAVADAEAAKAAEHQAEDKAAEALRAERAAQDRYRDAAEHARQADEARKRVQGRGTPAEQTEALLKVQAAAQVAAGEQAAAEGAAARRELADRDLAAARAAVTAAEEAVRITRDLAAHPGRALYSPETCRENIAHLLRIWDTLQPIEQQLVKNAISALAMLTGVYDEIKLRGHAERDAELAGQHPQVMPFNPMGAMPGVAGR